MERVKRKARKLEKHKQWKKRHAENGKRRQEQIEKRRQKLEADIDRWQAEVRQEDERRQREDQEKQLLTKKEKQDSQRRKIKVLSRLIERLIELRRLRRKRLEAQGNMIIPIASHTSKHYSLLSIVKVIFSLRKATSSSKK